MTLPSDMVVTPFLRKLAAERAARLERFRAAGRAHASSQAQASEPPSPPPSSPPAPPPDQEAVQQWADRQKERFGLKPVWFSIESEIDPPERRRLTVAMIQRVVALHFGLSRAAELNTVRRTRDVVWPRQVAMFLAKNNTLHSYPEIGRRFGGRDHTTVLHACRKVEAKLKRDPRLALEIDALASQIEREME